jgi:hypothetical protein
MHYVRELANGTPRLVARVAGALTKKALDPKGGMPSVVAERARPASRSGGPLAGVRSFRLVGVYLNGHPLGCPVDYAAIQHVLERRTRVAHVRVFLEQFRSPVLYQLRE